MLKLGQVEIPPGLIFLIKEYCFCFVNPNGVFPGHVLITTKREARTIKDMNSAEMFDFFLTIQEVQRRLEVYFKVNSSTILINDGDEIDQVYAHLIPRQAGDFQNNDQIYVLLHQFDKKFEQSFKVQYQHEEIAKAFQQLWDSNSQIYKENFGSE